MRSTKLPMAPASTSIRARPSNHRWRGKRRNQTTRTKLILMLMEVNNQRCQPPASARKLKAAPGLWARIRSKNGHAKNRSPSIKLLMIKCLSIWSVISSSKPSHPQRCRADSCSKSLASGKVPHLTCTDHIFYTTPTQVFMITNSAHVFAVVPATLTF